MLEFLNAETLKQMFLAGAENLSANKEWINELNVFPVPDGDTGTNMTMTVMSAVNELKKSESMEDLADVCRKISSGTLRGARGNSGVIMSQLCRGFCKEAENETTIDKKKIAEAIERAVVTAYKAVMKPKEGTILTVAKGAAQRASELADSDISLDEFFKGILEYAEFVLSKTPTMLPVLKEAGVVDSGGQGLVEFIRGAIDGYHGKVSFAESNQTAFENVKPSVERSVDSTKIETADIKFGYCTEFIIKLERKYTEADEQELKDFLSSIGDSLVVVSMDDIVKVHVHTNHPGQAFEKALTYGSLTSMKVDNMREEHNEKVIHEADRAAMNKGNAEIKAAEAAFQKEFAFVAVCAGDGMAEIYRGMNVDVVIEGGQTMNPCTDDFLNAIEQIKSPYIFILPNNGNIIMAAQQAKELSSEKKVSVIPTKTVAQGITALFDFVPSKSFEENTKAMTEAAKRVKTGEVTYAVRDTEIDGKKISKDDYMGIGDGKMLAVGKDIKEVATQMIGEMVDENTELITIYYGEGTDEEAATELAELAENMLNEKFEDVAADIEVIYGGQPVYYYIVSVE